MGTKNACRFNLYAAFTALFTALCFPIFISSQEIEKQCKDIEVQCVCGIGSNKTFIKVPVKMYKTINPENGKIKCSGYKDPYQACAARSCFLSLNEKFGNSSNEESFRKMNPVLSRFFPQEVNYPRGDEPEAHHRAIRQSNPCGVPQLKNAEIKCWKWPNWLNCDITCIYGHALDLPKGGTVTKTNINCRLTENVWKPFGFQDCKPFINCKVQLKKPGELKCKEPIDGPAFCEISCLDYDQYDATAKQKYECVDDTYKKTLPHCASLNDNVKLISKPK